MSAESERLRGVVSLLRGIAQDEAITDLERALTTSPGPEPFPMPNTEHPALSEYADTVRSARVWLDRLSIVLPKPTRVTGFDAEATFPTSEIAMDTFTMTCRTCVAPAPFVGRRPFDEARYTWRVWVDDLGRWIACDAELQWRWRA